MPPVYICSSKSSMYMQLVSISFEFQLLTDKCSSPSSPRLFTVSHTHGNVSDNAQTVERHPSYTELSYENSLDIERSWKSLWKNLPRILNSSSPLHFCLLCSYFGLLFLPPSLQLCTVCPVPTPPANSFPKQKCRDSKVHTKLPHSQDGPFSLESAIWQKY